MSVRRYSLNIQRSMLSLLDKIDLKIEIAFFAGIIMGGLVAYLLFVCKLGIRDCICDGAITYYRYSPVCFQKLFVRLLFHRGMELLLISSALCVLKKYIWIFYGLLGALFGYLFTAGICSYGMAGILFSLITLFPHFIFYLIFMLMILYREEYVRNCLNWSTKHPRLNSVLLWFILLVLVAIIGIVLECYVNSFFEKIFFILLI